MRNYFTNIVNINFICYFLTRRKYFEKLIEIIDKSRKFFYDIRYTCRYSSALDEYHCGRDQTIIAEKFCTLFLV